MKKCKNFLLLLSFFALGVHLSVQSAEYQEADLQRLIRNHPLIKDFQPETGRFKNTPSEIQPVERLIGNKNKLTLAISELEKEKRNKLAEHLVAGNAVEEQLWEKIKEIDSEVEKHQKEIRELDDLIAAKGVPGFETVIKISEQLWNDISVGLPSNEAIILNKLPFQPPDLPPTIENRDLRHFFYSPSPENLQKYINYSIETGFLFQSINKTILYSEKK